MRLRIARAFGLAAVYLLTCRIMLAPIFNFAHPASARSTPDFVTCFPSASSAATMRTVGIQYVVFHGRQLEHGLGLTSQAAAGGDFRLLAQRDDDYLFEVSAATLPPR